jgi:exonuclease SbcC
MHPFAGIADKKIELADGLNLIYGPNEAGKSTLFNAIQIGLLTKTNLTSSKVDEHLGDYFPLGGGDVIRVTMKLESNDRTYKLYKEWKPGTRNGTSSLIKPGGTEITNEDDVQNWVLDNLPVKAATMKEIMLTKQSALHQTLSKIRDLSDVKQDIGAVLRKSVMETGGISVDKFRECVNEKHKEFFEHWDRTTNRPEKDSQGRDRGVDHKWSYPKGILEKWYSMEEEKRKYTEIVIYENTVDELNQKLQEKNEVLNTKQKWLEHWEPKLDQLREKEVLEAKIKSIQKDLDELHKIAEEWPVYKKELNEQQPKLDKYNQKLEKLNKEQEVASQKSRFESLQKRVTKLNEIKKQVSELNVQIERAPNVSEEDFEAISSLQSDIETLQVKANASKLSLNIEALQSIEFRINYTDGKEEVFNLSKGETKKLTKEGGAILQSEQLIIKVASGDGNIGEVIGKLDEKNKKLKVKLESFDSSSVAEIKLKYQQYQELVSKKETKLSQFNDLLEDDKLEKLNQQLEEVPNFANVRELTDIQKERDEVLEKRSALNSRFEGMKKKVEEWEDNYKNTSGVFSKLGSLTTEIDSLKKKLKNMPELPEQFENFDAFKQEINDVEKSIIELKDKVQEIELEMTSLDNPEVAAEEQGNIKEDAESDFERMLDKAGSLYRVKEKTDEILSQLEEKTYTPLVEGLIKWLSKMSGGRFEEVKLPPVGKEIPDKFVTNDNKEIPFQLLSHGTKDLTALAWRLTVIEQFLQDKESCILLDDPLVDMDKERKKMASDAIKDLAKNQQVLLFSCHGEVKNLLSNENVIGLTTSFS